MSSASANTNDSGIQYRSDFVRSVLKDTFNLTVRQVRAIAYEEDFPFPYNNFVYVVEVEPQAARQSRHPHQPGTQDIPSELREFILRLPNPLSGYNDKVRVENEVAALDIARISLEAKFPGLVPRVFGWGTASNGKQGWILQEYMPGCGLHADFPKLSSRDQKSLIDQMAQAVGCFQRYQIPESIDGYGGLTFSETGHIMSAPMSILDGGPFETYEGLVSEMIRSNLIKADAANTVNGWRDNGIRARLDTFLEDGIEPMVKKFTKRDKTLVHADFSTDNVLYDPKTMRLTAILDFDFAHIGTVADDFFRSFGRGIGRFPNPRDGEEMLALNIAMLHGFPDPIPPPTEDVQWLVAKVWDNALSEYDVDRPSTIPGMEELSELFWLSSQLLPFKLTEEVVVRNSTEKQLASRKAEGERLLDQFLKAHGY